jgi:hypothetical protein
LILYLGGGLAIGALVDAAIKERVTIYQARQQGGASLAVQPMLTLHGAGGRIVLRF